MSLVVTLFVIVAIGTSLLGWIAVSGEKSPSLKFLAYGCVVGVLVTSWLGLSELLSRSKSMDLAWFEQAEEAQVLAANLIEDEAIYLWLSLPGEPAPRAYHIPWTDENAKALHGAQQQAEREGSQVRMTNPFNMSADPQQEIFYAKAQTPPPPKQVVFDKVLDVTAVKSD